MKNIIGLSLFVLLIIAGCKKEEKAASPSTPPVTSAFTSADSTISGDWILDLSEVYLSGGIVSSTPHSDPVNCHLVLNLVESGTPGGWKNSIFALNCTNLAQQWRLNTGYLDLQATLYQIVSQTSTNLELQYGSMSPGNTAQKFYLHK